MNLLVEHYPACPSLSSALCERTEVSDGNGLGASLLD